MRDSFNSYTLDALALAGATAAVSDAAYYEAVRRRIVDTRERTAEALAALGFSLLPSRANFIFMKPPSGLASGASSGAAFFADLRERGILVRHFNKELIADYLRVSIGTDEDMNIFIDACKEIINKSDGRRGE